MGGLEEEEGGGGVSFSVVEQFTPGIPLMTFFKAADCMVNSPLRMLTNSEAFLALIAGRVIKTGRLSRRRDEDVARLKLL